MLHPQKLTTTIQYSSSRRYSDWHINPRWGIYIYNDRLNQRLTCGTIYQQTLNKTLKIAFWVSWLTRTETSEEQLPISLQQFAALRFHGTSGRGLWRRSALTLATRIHLLRRCRFWHWDLFVKDWERRSRLYSMRICNNWFWQAFYWVWSKSQSK